MHRSPFVLAGLLSLLLSRNAAADPPAPPATSSSHAALKIVGGAAAFGAAYGFVWGFADPHDLAYQHHPIRVPVYGPLVFGVEALTRRDDYGGLAKIAGAYFVVGGIVQCAGLGLFVWGVVEAIPGAPSAPAPARKISVGPRAGAHEVGLVLSLTE